MSNTTYATGRFQEAYCQQALCQADVPSKGKWACMHACVYVGAGKVRQ